MAIMKKTVLVLGAGASHPYGFPLGETLLKGIVQGIRSSVYDGGRLPSPSIRQGLLDSGFSTQALDNFASRLASSGMFSIDEYLETHPEDIKLGSRAIAAYLIPFENIDVLLSSPIVATEWYRHLLKMIGTTRYHLDETWAKLSIITYNYDRSLEYFLYHALTAGCNLKPIEATEMLKKLPLVHIHGQLGKPEFFIDGLRDYSTEVTPDLILACADQIKVIHSANQDSVELKYARERISEAEYVVFLGFGYHPTNMKRLQLTYSVDKARKYHGTAYRLEPNERRLAQRTFHGAFDLGSPDEDIQLFIKRNQVWDDITR